MLLDESHTRSCVTLHVLSAFTDGEAGGNPAGVVLDAGSLTEAQMQAAAAQAALSETAFVTPLADGAFRWDFFTPNRRIADCGHATIAAFALLHELGRVGVGETAKQVVDGGRKVIVAPDGAIFMEMREPRYQNADEWGSVGLDEVLAALGIGSDRLDPRIAPVLADAGGPFVTVAVRDADDLAAIVPDHAAILRVSDRLDLTGIYAYALDPTQDRAATTRMFAPRYGIPEESATGMAAGALGAVLHDTLGRVEPVFLIEQGRHMAAPSPSILEVRLKVADGRVSAITTGGRAVLRDPLHRTPFLTETIMTPEPLPGLHATRHVAGDLHVLPGWLPVEGLGALPVNAFLLAGPEPMLVDTGVAALSDAVLTGIEARIDLADLR